MAAPLEPEAAGQEAHHDILDNVLFAQRLEAPRPHRAAPHTQDPTSVLIVLSLHF